MPTSLRVLILIALPVLALAGQAHACSIRSIGVARSDLPAFVFVAAPDTTPVPEW